MPMLEVASTAQVEPLIVPLSTPPLSGAFQVTLGASACAPNGRPADSASETAALTRRTLLGNCGTDFIRASPLDFDRAKRLSRPLHAGAVPREKVELNQRL